MSNQKKSIKWKLAGEFEARYSGTKSYEFWERIDDLPRSENAVVYNLGCALQDLEGRVVAALNRAERKGKSR